MSDTPPAPGHVGFFDLTVPDAERVRAFYETVAGWTSTPHPMGEYADYEMSAPDGTRVAGICHRRGVNAEVPPHWMLYVHVADLDASLAEVRRLGGAIVGAVRDVGPYGRLAYVEDPSGAGIALLQPPSAVEGDGESP